FFRGTTKRKPRADRVARWQTCVNAVVAREGGRSSTPRCLGSSTAAPGILGSPGPGFAEASHVGLAEASAEAASRAKTSECAVKWIASHRPGLTALDLCRHRAAAPAQADILQLREQIGRASCRERE